MVDIYNELDNYGIHGVYKPTYNILQLGGPSSIMVFSFFMNAVLENMGQKNQPLIGI